MIEPAPSADTGTGSDTTTNILLPVIELIVVENLDVSARIRFSEQLEEAVKLRPGLVVVDLSSCGFIDAAALDLLMDTERKLVRQGGHLTVRVSVEDLAWCLGYGLVCG